ncbi:molybdenum cofactor guanylyltransferase [Sulfobacillus thermosulfidooxidans]|uniref:molybdenum cofactor guanylyltransferase n=1 Tax=Sulfobacillus thermosulfidooxidans TaxID=28034 RepID=UPI0006B52D1E|nr:molybdenum cofactor guanylyltransferase [Sulfobacillus thermosulfidooxidans]
MDPIIDGVVLAGGQSSRMGEDKAQLPLPNGMRLVDRAVLLLKTVVNGRLWISRPWNYANPGDDDLLDSQPFEGPLAGIERAMTSSHADFLAVMAVDLPNLPTDFYKWLHPYLSDDVEALLPQGERHRQPLAGFWSTQLITDLVHFRQTGGQKVETFLKRHTVKWVPVPEAWLRNVNTPSEWQAWLNHQERD